MPKPPLQPFYLPEPQPHATDWFNRAHDQAIWSFGEYVIVFLMWQVSDVDAGRAEPCHRCFVRPEFETFRQPTESKCPNCFGTTIEGGYKAKLVRPSLWIWDEETVTDHKHGEYLQETAQRIELPGDFFMNQGDIVLRADTSRWVVPQAADIEEIRTGWTQANRQFISAGQQIANVQYANENTPPYIIPPTDPEEIAGILAPTARYPRDMTQYEEIREGASLF